MRYIAGIFLFCCILGCKDLKKRHKPKSNGRINTIAVVSDKTLWESSVGEALRGSFNKSVEGLPTKEPEYSLHHIPTNIFEGNTRNSRNIIVLLTGNASGVKVADNPYAKPQKVMYITGTDHKDMIRLIAEHSPKIKAIVKAVEFKEEANRIKENTLDVSPIQKKLKIHLDIPSTFKIVKEENAFFWLERPLPKSVSHTSNIILYTLPLKTFPKQGNLAEKVVKLRDSIGKKYIPGRQEGMYMITEPGYLPTVNSTKLCERNALETRGIWEVKNFLMAGPFLNYMIEDTKNNRVVVVEGFVFAPSINKRDFVFELEVVAKSITFD